MRRERLVALLGAAAVAAAVAGVVLIERDLCGAGRGDDPTGWLLAPLAGLLAGAAVAAAVIRVSLALTLGIAVAFAVTFGTWFVGWAIGFGRCAEALG